jgi:hypothetical protein
VGLYHYGGVSPVAAFSQPLPVAVQPAVQVLVRSSDYHQAERTAVRIHNLMFGIANTDMPRGLDSTSTGTVRWLVATPNQYPFDMGKDAAGRDMFSCNYAIQRTPTT